MSLLDCDDDTLRDRMERSPELLVPEVRRLQAEVRELRRSAARWEAATYAGILAAGLDAATAERAGNRIRELIPNGRTTREDRSCTPTPAAAPPGVLS